MKVNRILITVDNENSMECFKLKTECLNHVRGNSNIKRIFKIDLKGEKTKMKVYFDEEYNRINLSESINLNG